MTRKTTIVMVWDCEVYDDSLKVGGDPGNDSSHVVNNIPDWADYKLGGDEAESYALRNVTVYEAEQFGLTIADAIKSRSGAFA